MKGSQTAAVIHPETWPIPVAVNRSIRYRVNVSTSVKGVKTWDCTVDGEGFTLGEVLDQSDLFVAELENRYPPPVEGTK